MVGESIFVSGCCLMVVEILGMMCYFEVGVEMFVKMILGSCEVGDLVNVERVMKVVDWLGGYIVIGYVDCVGCLVE